MRRRLSVAVATIALTTAAPAGLATAQPVAPEGAPWAQDGAGGPAYDFMRRAWGRMTADDRAAIFDAYLSALRVGLKLTPDQDKLWPPVEAALRGAATQMIEHRRALMSEGPPPNPVEGLRRLADQANATGDSLRKIADAAQPLYATLSEDQKRRLPILLHGFRPAPMMVPGRMGRADPMREPVRAEPMIGWGLPE